MSEHINWEEEDWTGTVTKPEPDLSIARKFWDEVAGPGEPIRLRFLNKRATMGPRAIEREYPSVEAAWPAVEANQASGYDVYYFPNTPSPGHRDGEFAGDKHVSRVRSLFADFDKGLPDQFHCEPNVIVHTSRMEDGTQRAQALWLTNYPQRSGLEGDSPNYARMFKDAERDLLMGYPTADPAAVNISRVLRLPGSVHLGRQQLVTFEVRHRDGPPRPGMAPTAHRRFADDILAGLPQRDRTPAPRGEKQDRLVNVDHLRHLLGYITPDCEYTEWRDVIYAIRSTRLLSAIPSNIPGITPPDDYETLLNIALEWSRGELDHAGRFADGLPLAYYGSSGSGGDEQIEALFEGADPDGEITFGTIHHAAQRGGWQPAQAEQVKPPEDDVLPSWVPRDVLRSGRHYAMLPRFYKDAPEFKFFDDDKVLPNNPDGAVGLLYANYSSHKTNWAVAVSIKLIVEKGLLIVYCAGEGDIDVGALRVPAIAARAHGMRVEDFDNFVIIPSVPNLALDPPNGHANAKDRAALTKLLHEIERKHRRKIDVIWVDTLATATVGVEENTSEFGGLLTKAGPVGLLAKEFKALVITIHHTGKDEARGARGSNALNCNIDLLLSCKYDDDHNVLRLFVEKSKTTAARFSTFYRFENNGWPVPIQIGQEEFEMRGGTVEGSKKQAKEQDSKAKDLRAWLRTQVEKWPTWAEGPSDAEVAKLYMEAHGEPEPPSGHAEEHQKWRVRKKKMMHAFVDAHHKSGSDPATAVARYLGDWQVEGKNDAWRWRWFNNGLSEPVVF